MPRNIAAGVLLVVVVVCRSVIALMITIRTGEQESLASKLPYEPNVFIAFHRRYHLSITTTEANPTFAEAAAAVWASDQLQIAGTRYFI